MSPVPDPSSVLARFGPAVASLRWAPVGGGFSGAAVWRGSDPSGRPAFALKAWPPDTTPDRLERLHLLMRRATRLPFIPAVVPAADGRTVVESAGRGWDVTAWMPGAADFHANPSPVRLAAACGALAALHAAWRPAAPASAACPGVGRRLRLLDEWAGSVLPSPLAGEGRGAARGVRGETSHPGSQPPEGGSPTPHPQPLSRKGRGEQEQSAIDLLSRAHAAVARLAAPVRDALVPWATRPVSLQPCLCDPWHDHVLFVGDAVSGLIDFGAAKGDHVSVDLARLLGSLVGGDDAAFAAGLDAYRAAGGRLDVPDEFVRLLDRSGAVCGAANWLLRLTAGRQPLTAAVAVRLRGLVERLEGLRGRV